MPKSSSHEGSDYDSDSESQTKTLSKKIKKEDVSKNFPIKVEEDGLSINSDFKHGSKPKKQANKKRTYHEYVLQKKAKNHKCREGWETLLNKLGEHSINLGQSLETSWRDYEGTSIIFTSDGHNAPLTGNFSKESNTEIAKRHEATQRDCKET